MTGRAVAGPKVRAATPGWLSSVAPSDISSCLLELLAREHGRRLIRLELASRLGADRDHFVKVQLGIDAHIDGRGGRRRHGDFRAPGRVALGADRHVIGAGRHVIEAESACRIGCRLAAQLFQQYGGPRNGLAR